MFLFLDHNEHLVGHVARCGRDIGVSCGWVSVISGPGMLSSSCGGTGGGRSPIGGRSCATSSTGVPSGATLVDGT